MVQEARDEYTARRRRRPKTSRDSSRKEELMDIKQAIITKYQLRFNRLMKSIEKDKVLKKIPGNATAGIAVQMIKDLKNYLKVRRR